MNERGYHNGIENVTQRPRKINLTKDEIKELWIDPFLLKDGQCGDGVCGTEECSKGEQFRDMWLEGTVRQQILKG